MRPFSHANAQTVHEASVQLSSGNAKAIAGGTDLLGTLKDNLLPIYPDKVVNLKAIKNLDYVKQEQSLLRIGSLTKLSAISEHPVIKEKYSALSQAAGSVATPHIRNMATIGGNLAQLPRCWYFRKADNRFNCIRKGGEECFAILGDNRYHSIFGGSRCADTPCMSQCPAGTNIPAYLEEIRKDNWDKAAEIFLSAHPFPMITGRVCAHFCQSACNRHQTDEGVLTGGVERALGDYILENSDKFYKKPTKETNKSVAVVGSGPAGLTAAYFLRRAGNKVTVYERMDCAGGMLRYAIPAYRLPKDIVEKIISILENMGIEFVLGHDFANGITPEKLEKEYDGVCYATGAWKRPIVGISGEELTVFGLDFLVEVRKWMDGKVGEEVLVVGGGNVAMDVAVTAKRLGARKVTLACVEPRERMPASSEEIARAEAEGIVIMPSWGPSKVIENNGVLNGMELKRCVSVVGDDGTFNPQYDENEQLVVSAQNILLAIGQRVDLSFLGDKYHLQLNERGLIDVDADSQRTSRPGVFAAGDATTGPATVVSAVSNGKKAADGLCLHLGISTQQDNPGGCASVTVDANGITCTTSLKLRELDINKRTLETEDSQTPGVQEAEKEAKRCLNCGCYAVSPSDIAPALIALNAQIVTHERTINAEDFFNAGVMTSTTLGFDEIITEIIIPALPDGAKSVFKKMALRKSIDFPIINFAIVTGSEPRISLGAVAPHPLRAMEAEQVLRGKTLDEKLAGQVGEAAVRDATPFESTKYKVQILKTLIKRALLELA
ncbi:MAG: FAD-dependent oxidoreductase [Oscillospiraceae bacterium]|nr:FAD-dependent oxidoreductase [Oscillospiraceae bacterium]